MATGKMRVNKHLLADVLYIPDGVDIRGCSLKYGPGFGEYIEIDIESDSIPNEDDGKQFDVVVTTEKRTSRLVRCTTPPRISTPELDEFFNELRKNSNMID